MSKTLVAVLTRAFPGGTHSNTCTKVLTGFDRVRDVMDWADNQCATPAVKIRLEITEAEGECAKGENQ